VLKMSILTLNFPKIRVFQLQSLHFSTKNFLTIRRFSDSPKFRGGRRVPPATTPLIALKYEAAPPALRGLRRPWIHPKSTLRMLCRLI